MLSVDDMNRIWASIQSEYWCGRVVSERDLQAQLSCKLRSVIPNLYRVVVEPIWGIGSNKQIPDMVITDGDVITDIFELKFVPYGFADAKGDLAKLVGYSSVEAAKWPVTIVPETGAWVEGIELASDCRMHFVVISKHAAAAVWPESLPIEVPHIAQSLHKITLWYGRILNDSILKEDWGVVKCI